MTPTNTAMTPEIKNIADNNGDKHTVIPTPHTHAQSEVGGLAAALAGKQDALTFDSTPTIGSTNPVTSGGVYNAISDLRQDTDHDLEGKADKSVVNAALAGKQDALTFDSTPTTGSTNPVTSGGVKAALDGKYSINQVDENDEQEAHLLATAEDDSIYFDFRLKNGNTQKRVLLTIPKMDNFNRAISNPDTIPTSNSDNLVTSGGVKAALNQKVDLSNFSEKVDRLDSFTTSDVDEKINLPTVFDDDHYSTTYIIENYTSEDRTLDSFFNEGSDYLVCEPNKIIHPNSYVIAKVIKYNNGNTLFFVVVEGIYEM